MPFDQHRNFAYSTVATAPSPADSGTSLVVAAGEGSRFPTPPFNATVWPASAQPLPGTAEIVRVTAIATDTLTIVRAQEGSTARSIVVGDQIAATITDRILRDVEHDPSIISVVEDDFYGGGFNLDDWGDLAWRATNGSLTMVVGAENHPGIYRRETGGTAGTIARSELGPTAMGAFGHDFGLIWIVRLGQSDANTEARFGLSDDYSTQTPVHGIYFEKKAADTNWFGTCRRSNTESRVDLGVATGTGWVRLAIRSIAGTVFFSINGGTESAVSTNVPVAADGFARIGWQIINPGAAVNKTCDIDYFRLAVRLTR